MASTSNECNSYYLPTAFKMVKRLARRQKISDVESAPRKVPSIPPEQLLVPSNKRRCQENCHDGDYYEYERLVYDLLQHLLDGTTIEDSKTSILRLLDIVIQTKESQSRANIAYTIYQKGGIDCILKFLQGSCDWNAPPHIVTPEPDGRCPFPDLSEKKMKVTSVGAALALLVEVTSLEPESRFAVVTQGGFNIVLKAANDCSHFGDMIALIRNLALSDSSRHAVTSEECIEMCLQSLDTRVYMNIRNVSNTCQFLSEIILNVPDLSNMLLQKGVVSKLGSAIDHLRVAGSPLSCVYREAKVVLNLCIDELV